MSIINLLPEDYLHQRAQMRANVMCAMLFAVVMAGVGGAALVSEQSTRNTTKVRDQVNASYAEAAKLLGQMQQLEAQKRTMITKAETTASLLERVPRSYVLAVVTQALPETASLETFDLTPRIQLTATKAPTSKFDALAAAKPVPQAATVVAEVKGYASTDVEVARFIANLMRNPLLSNVDLVFSQEKKRLPEDMTVREFCVRMEIRPGVDVIDVLKDSAKGKLAKQQTPKAPQGAQS